jgi:hypothetical protein
MTLNATLQPYKNKWHNIIDSLIFMNLIIINGISLFIYQKINEGKDHLDSVKKHVTRATISQLVLIYLPLLYLIAYCTWKLIEWAKNKVHEWKISKLDYSQERLLDSIYLPPLRDESNSTASFHKFE